MQFYCCPVHPLQNRSGSFERHDCLYRARNLHASSGLDTNHNIRPIVSREFWRTEVMSNGTSLIVVNGKGIVVVNFTEQNLNYPTAFVFYFVLHITKSYTVVLYGTRVPIAGVILCVADASWKCDWKY